MKSYYVQFINTKEREFEMYQEGKVASSYEQLIKNTLAQAEFLKANVFDVDTVKILSALDGKIIETFKL